MGLCWRSHRPAARLQGAIRHSSRVGPCERSSPYATTQVGDWTEQRPSPLPRETAAVRSRWMGERRWAIIRDKRRRWSPSEIVDWVEQATPHARAAVLAALAPAAATSTAACSLGARHSAVSGDWRRSWLLQIGRDLAGFPRLLAQTARLRSVPLHVSYPLPTGLAAVGLQAIAGHASLRETLGGPQLLGTALILVGIALAARRPASYRLGLSLRLSRHPGSASPRTPRAGTAAVATRLRSRSPRVGCRCRPPSAGPVQLGRECR